jgi:hypothetical protein
MGTIIYACIKPLGKMPMVVFWVVAPCGLHGNSGGRRILRKQIFVKQDVQQLAVDRVKRRANLRVR